MTNTRFLVLFLAVALLLVPRSLQAQHGAQTAPADLDQIIQRAHTIFRGHVVSVRVEPHPQFSNLETVVVTMTVDRQFKGEVAATITFRQFVIDPRDLTTSLDYRPSDELLLFLNPVSLYGLTSPVGLEQGRFRISRDAKGIAIAVNGRGNVGLFDQVANKAASRGIVFSKRAATMLSKGAGKIPLSAMEDAISALTGAQ